MKFLHTSDWHIGRQFHSVSLVEDQKAVLTQLIDYLRENPVDALVIAGDIYDRSVPPTAAIEIMNKFVSQVCDELKLPIILIPGNHDGAERLGFGSSQMKRAGLHILSSFEDMLRPVVIKSDIGEVAFYGMPYNDPEMVRYYFKQSISTFDEAHCFLAGEIKSQFKPEQKNVLLSHCFVDGAIGSDSERPLSIGGSDRVSHEHFVDFDYVALGHLHQPQKKGQDYIRYSGSLMKYSFSEQHHKKGVTLVEFDECGFKSATHVDLTAPRQMRIIEGELNNIIEQGKDDPNNEDYLLVRLMDTHAILNPMEKLRTVYPNVLHIEKPGILVGVEKELATAKLARSEVDMFRDFFQQTQSVHLSDEQDKAVAEIITQLSQNHKETQ
ncbi:exonuclease SbcCD subunit D [Vibrio pectenicida]|uniref:Nuclease SbcCD subunit D n=1 Tax=Vibrio pectenicida TaxID=62763 RepID=A0A427U3B5_9VIBR|nr:exonuclease SbcCD subunit D [Vibrio pectenicida]RSD31143.1 exonuclease SbcCD subunit D [Vibrio pectenicida]